MSLNVMSPVLIAISIVILRKAIKTKVIKLLSYCLYSTMLTVTVFELFMLLQVQIDF
jgi:hypothetical protein